MLPVALGPPQSFTAMNLKRAAREGVKKDHFMEHKTSLLLLSPLSPFPAGESTQPNSLAL